MMALKSIVDVGETDQINKYKREKSCFWPDRFFLSCEDSARFAEVSFKTVFAFCMVSSVTASLFR